jgi:hypothetical protein
VSSTTTTVVNPIDCSKALQNPRVVPGASMLSARRHSLIFTQSHFDKKKGSNSCAVPSIGHDFRFKRPTKKQRLNLHTYTRPTPPLHKQHSIRIVGVAAAAAAAQGHGAAVFQLHHQQKATKQSVHPSSLDHTGTGIGPDGHVLLVPGGGRW